MSEFKADLHCHSTCSDGTDSPFELLEKAKVRGLKGLSITDHDTLDAYTPEFFKKAKDLKIEILSGVELSAKFRESPVHILGYGFDINSQSFRCFLQTIQENRAARNQRIYEKLKKLNILLPKELLSKKRVIVRPHFASALVELGIVKTFKAAFQKYLKEGASCYCPGFKVTPKEAIDAIHKARGKAVLAHPHFCRKSLLRELYRHPLDGIECYYGNMRDEKRFLTIAKERNWIATGGSDSHGNINPHIPLGCSWVDKETFTLLSSR